MRFVPCVVLCLLAGCGDITKPEGCPSGQEECSGACTDLMTDPANCGACGDACALAVHADPACSSGECVLVCSEGWYDIDSDYLTGCEYPCTFVSAIDACNGADDDCDGTIDNFSSDSCPQGAEVPCTTTCGSTGTGLCDEACNPPPPSECTPPSEECNGEDDDCVLGADNGYDCVQGEETTCTTTCGSEGTGTCLETCDPPPPGSCTPPVETCNGEDDDCVLGADNGFDCVRGEDTACTTACGSTGSAACLDDCSVPTGSACTPPVETCNWADDDCDTQVDEGLWRELIADVLVAGSTTSAMAPSLSFGNTNYLVAWSEDVSGLGLFAEAYNRAGTSVGGGDLLVGSHDDLPGGIAWSGSEFVIGFQDSRYGDTDVWGIRMGENGEPISVEVNISQAMNGSDSIRVNWTGSAWGFSWIDQRVGSRIYIAEESPINLLRSFEDDITAGLGYVFGHMDVAWSGSTYGICWGDDRGGSREPYFKAVTSTGLDVIPDTSIADNFDDVYACSIGWTGSEFVVGWAGRHMGGARGAYVMGIDPGTSPPWGSFEVVGPVAGTSGGRPVVVGVADGGIGVAWSRSAGGNQDIVIERRDFGLVEIGEAVVVYDGYDNGMAPVIAWDGSAFGIAWERWTSTVDSDVMLSRVGCI